MTVGAWGRPYIDSRRAWSFCKMHSRLVVCLIVCLQPGGSVLLEENVTYCFCIFVRYRNIITWEIHTYTSVLNFMLTVKVKTAKPSIWENQALKERKICRLYEQKTNRKQGPKTGNLKLGVPLYLSVLIMCDFTSSFHWGYFHAETHICPKVDKLFSTSWIRFKTPPFKDFSSDFVNNLWKFTSILKFP